MTTGAGTMGIRRIPGARGVLLRLVVTIAAVAAAVLAFASILRLAAEPISDGPAVVRPDAGADERPLHGFGRTDGPSRSPELSVRGPAGSSEG